MGVKINLTIKPKNHTADPKIGFQSHQFQSHADNVGVKITKNIVLITTF